MPLTMPISFENEDGTTSTGVHQVMGESSHANSPPPDVTITITDLKVLDCSICCLPLTVPVFQCDEGHLACSSCCRSNMIKNVCPSYSLPIGFTRCRAVEKILKSIKFSCTNKEYGCKKRVSYDKQHEHELMCIHEPCSCPHLGCDFVASAKLLYTHYFSEHSGLSNFFIYNSCFVVHIKKGMEFVVLQETFEKTIFLLNLYSGQSNGEMANITCIAPSAVRKGFRYELVARKGQNRVKLESITEIRPRWSENLPRKKCLRVPSEFLDSRGEHYFQVRIFRKIVETTSSWAQGSESSITPFAAVLAEDLEPKEIGISNVSTELASEGRNGIQEQPFSRPIRSIKTPKWLESFVK